MPGSSQSALPAVGPFAAMVTQEFKNKTRYKVVVDYVAIRSSFQRAGNPCTRLTGAIDNSPENAPTLITMVPLAGLKREAGEIPALFPQL